MTPRTGLRSYRGSWTKNGSSGWKWDTFRAAFRLAVAASVFSRSDPGSSAASSPCLPLFTASSFFSLLLLSFYFIFVAVNSTLGHWFISGRVSATMQGVGRQCKKKRKKFGFLQVCAHARNVRPTGRRRECSSSSSSRERFRPRRQTEEGGQCPQSRTQQWFVTLLMLCELWWFIVAELL